MLLWNDHPEYELKSPIRNASHTGAVLAAKASITIIIPPNDRFALEPLGAEPYIVINAEIFDDLDFLGALLRGLKRIFDDGKGRDVLVSKSSQPLSCRRGQD